MSETMTNGAATVETPVKAKAKARKPARSGARAKTKSRGRATAKKRAPKKGAMAKQGRYVLVIHMTKETQRALDKAIRKTGDSRSSYCRTLVESRLGIKAPKKRRG